MRNAESGKHPKEKEQTIVIPNIIRQSLDKKCSDSAKDAETNGFVDLRNSIFTEGQRALRKKENEKTKGEKSKNADFCYDL